MTKRLIIIAYDVTTAKRRRQVAATLQDYRIGGQKSLAQCWLTRHEFDELWQKLTRLIDLNTDHLLTYHHDERSTPLTLGVAQIYQGQPLIVG